MKQERSKSYLFICIGILLFMPCLPANADIELKRKADSLVSKMTLQEKVGQMTNISLMALASGDFWSKRDTVILDTNKIRDLLLNHHVGSVQNLGTYPFSTAEWRKIITYLQDVVQKHSRLKIPVLYGIDAVHGANYTAGSTLLPHQLGLAATWNPAFAERAGAITSYEVKASGIPWNYAPVLDVCKQPLWGRIFETFGEDTYLSSTMGAAMIRGSQGNSLSNPYSTAVCLKHLWGYGQPFNGKDRSPTYLPERILRQIHLPPFEAAIKQGALTVMLNSGSVNGIPSHADSYLITTILKGELEFEGFVISDWEDVVNLEKVHQVAADEKDAVRISVNAGLDMCMDPYDASFAKLLAELVMEGKVAESRVNDAVSRILYVKLKLGLFEQPLYSINQYPLFGSDEFADESYQTARESITLLKNSENILPLAKKGKVLVCGVAAHSLNYLNGAWSRTWSGVDTSFNDSDKATILEAVRAKIGANQTVYVKGSDYDKAMNIQEAVNAAKNVDYIVICLGEKPATEKPSDIDDLTLPQAQIELVKALSNTGKPIILVLVEARPRIIREIEPLAMGILMAYLPGNEGGRAISDVLFGDFNPCGKLPITYPRHTGSIWAYDHTKSDTRDAGFGFDGFNPQFEFGFGLSYTTFEYSNLRLNTDTLFASDTLVIQINVSNKGKRSGKEVVQLFTSDVVASFVPAVKQLRAFEKIELKEGETKTVSFQLNKNDLAFVDANNRWITETGDFIVGLGNLKAGFYYQSKAPAKEESSMKNNIGKIK